MLAHITPAEARMLRRRGGSGTINPITGLPEFFLKKVAKAVGNTLKSVGKAVSGAVKGIVNGVKDFAKSSIGKIVTSVALGFFLGPAAAGFLGVSSVAGVAAVSGFVGGFGSSILAGNSFKDSLKNGAIGGVTAGATAGITGGMGAFEAGSYAGPTTVAGQWDKAINSGKSLLGISTPSTAGTSISAEQLGTAVDSIDAAAGVPTVEQLANAPPPDLTVGRQAIQPSASGISGPGIDVAAVQSPVVSDASGSLISQNVPVEPVYQQTAGEFVLSNEPRPFITGPELGADRLAGAPSGMNFQNFEPSYGSLTRPGINMGDAAINQATLGANNLTPEQIIPPNASFARGPVSLGPEPKSFFGKTVDFFNPAAREASGIENAADVFNKTYTRVYDSTIALPGQTAATAGEAALKAAQAAQTSASPGIFNTYGPIAGAGLGAAYLGGAFTPEEPGSPNLAPKETGTDLLRAQPGVYGTTPGGANVTYASLPTGYNYSPMQMLYRPQITMGNPYGNIYGQRRMFAQGGIAAVAPAKFNLGGYASGGIGSMAKKYPRRTGQISGPGTGTSDDIPAMLSDGEFVMTAKAVRGAGKGSRREGAKRMYAMMRKFEGKA
jgi:hypothetical protein